MAGADKHCNPNRVLVKPYKESRMNIQPAKAKAARHQLARSHHRINFSAETSKLTEEINFLRDRVNKIKGFKSPNPEMLEIYETMLNEREIVLSRLRESGLAQADIQDAG